MCFVQSRDAGAWCIMQDWQEWEVSALPLVPLSIRMDTEALWQQDGVFQGLKRLPSPTDALEWLK